MYESITIYILHKAYRILQGVNNRKNIFKALYMYVCQHMLKYIWPTFLSLNLISLNYTMFST